MSCFYKIHQPEPQTQSPDTPLPQTLRLSNPSTSLNRPHSETSQTLHTDSQTLSSRHSHPDSSVIHTTDKTPATHLSAQSFVVTCVCTPSERERGLHTSNSHTNRVSRSYKQILDVSSSLDPPLARGCRLNACQTAPLTSSVTELTPP